MIDYITDLKLINKNSIETILIYKNKDFDIREEHLKDLYEVLKDNGSLFIHYNKSQNETEFKEIFNSQFKIFQMICVNTSNPEKQDKKLNSLYNDIVWLSKKVPKKFKKNLPKDKQKEVWITDSSNPQNYLKEIEERIINLTFEKKQCEEKDILILKLGY